MKKIRSILITFYFSLLTFHNSSAQGLSAFLTIRDEFYVFDDSVTRKIDYLKPQSFKIGGNCVAFISSDKSFKVYQGGRVIKVNDGFTTDYKMSSDYVLMINNTSLYVFDNGKATLLARNPIDYVAADSIIGFSDPITESYYVYTEGKISILTADIIGNPITVNALGKNLLAYITVDDSLKIFYHDRIYPQPVQNVTVVRAGKNIVAYKNNYNDEFALFYKGKNMTLETFPIRQFFVGDDLVAYVTQEGVFKIFYDGKIYTLGTFTPENLGVVDNLVTFKNELGYFILFYKGRTYQLDRYFPDHFEEGENSLFYIGTDQRINFFSFGKQEELPMDNYRNVRLDYDVLQVQLPPFQYKFYYKGHIY